MDYSPLCGAFLKLKRANKHIRDLNRKVAIFFEQNPRPCTFVSVNDYKSRETAIRFEQRSPIPQEFGLIIGGAAHNLRSSLDLAMSGILVPLGANPEKVQFPFAKRANSLESTISSRLVERAGEKVVAAIRDLKPYPGGNNDLYGLHELDITDKHRVFIVVASLSSLEGLNIPGFDTGTWAYQEMRRVAFAGLKDKQEIYRGPYDFRANRRLRRANPAAFESKQDIGGSFHIAFERGFPFEGNGVIPILVRLSNVVKSVLINLQLAIVE